MTVSQVIPTTDLPILPTSPGQANLSSLEAESLAPTDTYTVITSVSIFIRKFRTVQI